MHNAKIRLSGKHSTLKEPKAKMGHERNDTATSPQKVQECVTKGDRTRTGHVTLCLTHMFD